jgi:hypothetical protein
MNSNWRGSRNPEIKSRIGGFYRALRVIALVAICFPSLKYEVHAEDTLRTKNISENNPSSTPDLLAILTRNLLSPIVRTLLPGQIKSNDGHLVARITDALYCGVDSQQSALILVQIARADAQHYATDLALNDCAKSDAELISEHTATPGFAGLMRLKLTWSEWQLKISSTEFAPKSQTEFSELDSSALENYNITVDTSSIPIVSGDIHENFHGALLFNSNDISVALYKMPPAKAAFPNKLQIDSISQLRDANVGISIKNDSLSDLLMRYPQDFDFNIDSLGININSFSYNAELDNSNNSVVANIGASAQYSGYKFNVTINLSGVPLEYKNSSVSPIPSNIASKFSARELERALETKMAGFKLLPKLKRTIKLNLNGESCEILFDSYTSSANIEFLNLIGNGEIDVKFSP